MAARRVGDRMIQEGEDTLRARAAAALSKQRLEERLRQQDAAKERCARAHLLLKAILGVEASLAALPVEIDGLRFDVDEAGGEWRLQLVRACWEPSCNGETRVTINSLALLGAELEAEADYCADCDC